MTRLAALLATLLLLWALPSPAQEVSEERARTIRARYSEAWEVQIPEGTPLAALRDRYQRRLGRIRETDVEDTSPYPVWFRAYLRDQLPDLPSQGPYQYPRVAAQILEWMVANPDLRVRPPSDRRALSREFAPSRIMTVGTNINITNLDERNSESFIAVDYADPQYLIASANNISGSGRQKQFRSSNGGTSWTATELPLASGSAFQSDPAVAWTTSGTAWAATLGINSLGNQVKVQTYKSTDRGANWSFVATVSSGNNNDKELMWIDTHPTSPFKDSIYVTWDVVGAGMRFARSTDQGATWSSITNLSSDGAIGAHLTTGPAGELYVAWPDTTSRQLKVRKSTDGGATFASAQVIATTNDSYEVSIPAMCQRKVLIYLAIGVDRSSGPRSGNVYVAWVDRNGAAADPGCGGVSSASNSNIYLSRSTDGGTTWSSPVIAHTNAAKTDQFNPWMEVDPHDGTIHLIFQDTRDDPGRKKAHVYYVRSVDGANTWIDETRVTTAATDETASGADLGNQYGDYNGLAAFRGVAHPVWTDRRSSVPGGKEQIFTAKLEPPPPGCPPPCLSLDPCLKHPWRCMMPELVEGLIVLECPFRDCIVFDPLPKNCLVKWDCPGCPPGGLCPPYYHIFLEGIEAGWEVGLTDMFGQRVDFEQFQTADGETVLSFRPEKELYIDGQIGDYFLVFRLGREGKPARPLKIKTRVKMSEERFSGGSP